MLSAYCCRVRTSLPFLLEMTEPVPETLIKILFGLSREPVTYSLEGNVSKGLLGKKTLVNIFQDVLTLEYGDHPLSRYLVEWQPHDTRLLRVSNP